MSQLLLGARYLLTGARLIFRPRIRRYALIPLAINIVIFSLVIAIVYHYVGVLIEQWTTRLSQWLIQLPSWLSWLSGVSTWIDWILWPLFILPTVLFVFFFFSVFANLIAAPFNGFLAEAVERHLTGDNTPSADVSLLSEGMTAIAHEFRKLRYFALRAVPLMILFLIPGLNILAPALWLLFSSWMLAVEYLDYPLSNHRVDFAKQHRQHRQQRALSLGFGAAVSFANMLPLFNFVVMPSAVAGASALFCAHMKSRLDQEFPRKDDNSSHTTRGA